MCERCLGQVRRLQNRLGLDEEAAVGVMWEHTCYPFGGPDDTDRQVDTFIASTLVNADAMAPARERPQP